MANKFNREDYPNLFAEVVMANGAVKGQFDEFQTNPKPELIINVNPVPYIWRQMACYSTIEPRVGDTGRNS